MKKASFILGAVLMTTALFTSCGGDASVKDAGSNKDTSSIKDLGSNEDLGSNIDSGYNEDSIGNQIWMSLNFDGDTFRNGDPIYQAKTDQEWKSAGQNKQPAWCYYDNEPKNGAKYGKLYNWYAVNDPRILAPKGWHIPSDAEWTTLGNYLRDVASKKMKRLGSLKANGNENNKSGLLVLLGGYRLGDGKFLRIGVSASWWSTTEANAKYALGRSTYGNDGNLGGLNDDIGYGGKVVGLSVRCLRD